MIKKLFILIILAAVAYATYRVIIYYASPIADMKKEGGDRSVPEDDSSRLHGIPMPGGAGEPLVYRV